MTASSTPPLPDRDPRPPAMPADGEERTIRQSDLAILAGFTGPRATR